MRAFQQITRCFYVVYVENRTSAVISLVWFVNDARMKDYMLCTFQKHTHSYTHTTQRALSIWLMHNQLSISPFKILCNGFIFSKKERNMCTNSIASKHVNIAGFSYCLMADFIFVFCFVLLPFFFLLSFDFFFVFGEPSWMHSQTDSFAASNTHELFVWNIKSLPLGAYFCSHYYIFFLFFT